MHQRGCAMITPPGASETKRAIVTAVHAIVCWLRSRNVGADDRSPFGSIGAELPKAKLAPCYKDGTLLTDSRCGSDGKLRTLMEVVVSRMSSFFLLLTSFLIFHRGASPLCLACQPCRPCPSCRLFSSTTSPMRPSWPSSSPSHCTSHRQPR